jgi:hypothetical protein
MSDLGSVLLCLTYICRSIQPFLLYLTQGKFHRDWRMQVPLSSNKIDLGSVTHSFCNSFFQHSAGPLASCTERYTGVCSHATTFKSTNTNVHGVHHLLIPFFSRQGKDLAVSVCWPL